MRVAHPIARTWHLQDQSSLERVQCPARLGGWPAVRFLWIHILLRHMVFQL